MSINFLHFLTIFLRFHGTKSALAPNKNKTAAQAMGNGGLYAI
jgi:hypothetical protein